MNGVEADDFARQMKAEHLFLTLMVDHVALETAGAHGGDGTEFVAGPEQVLAGLDGAGAVNDLLEALGFVGGQSAGQTELTERASAACNLCAGRFAAVITDIGYS